MTKKEDIEDYEFSIAAKRAVDMFDGVGFTAGQTWRSSLLEAHINGLIGAPIAIIAHIIMLMGAGLSASWEGATAFASASWVVFFYLSVGRQYLLRRIFEKYNIHLEPIYIFKYLKNLLFSKRG